MSSPDERGREQRERIIAAATASYVEKGYYETGIADVIDRARMSRRTLYSHFRDLNEVRFAVYETAVSKTFVKLAEVAQDPTPSDRLQTVLRFLFDTIVEQPHLARVVATEFRLPEQRNIEVRKQVLALFVGILFEGTAADAAEGRVPHPPDELMLFAFVGAVEGMAFKMIDDVASITPERAVSVLLHMYRSVYPWRPRA